MTEGPIAAGARLPRLAAQAGDHPHARIIATPTPPSDPLSTHRPSGRFLAFDTSTDTLSVGVSDGPHQWLHTGPGAAQSSTTLIPTLLALLAQAGLSLRSLDAIVFGRGPGSFTGLRTACAVAQGLAAGSNRPVLPIDTLMAVAEEARAQAQEPLTQITQITAMLDARMNEVYLQHFGVQAGQLQALGPCEVLAPERVSYPLGARRCVAGNALPVYRDRLPPLPVDGQWVSALPTAGALLRLAPGLLHHAVPAAQALPLYVRDKVAQTTDERLAAKAALADAAAHPRAGA